MCSAVSDRTFHCRFKAFTQDFEFCIILSKSLVLFVRHPAKGVLLYFCNWSFVVGISAFKSFKNKCLYTLYSWHSRWLFWHMLGGQFSPSQKCNVALIVLGGYCSCVALHSWHVQSLGTSHHNNCISYSPPRWRKDGTPSCQVQLEVGKKKGWLIR